MSTWTDSRIKLLTTLASEGWSASQIGEKLRISRNAVIGKVHRLGLNLSQIAASLGVTRKSLRPQKRAKPTPWVPPVTAAIVAEPLIAEVDQPPLPPVTDQPLTLLNLHPRSCKWPINDGHPEFYFCGKRRVGDSPYCREHTKKAYNRKPNPMERQT